MKMRTALAFLVDDEFINGLTPLRLRCRDYGFDFRILRLPTHVSLKQPFMVNDFARFDAYFEEFATGIEPKHLKFDGFVFWGTPGQGVVAARITGSPRLRQIHNLLNTELEQTFGETQADFDGDAYEFHITLAIGGFHGELLPQLRADIATWKLSEATVASKLAMFVYEESAHPDPLYGVREYGTYKVLPLQQNNHHS